MSKKRRRKNPEARPKRTYIRKPHGRKLSAKQKERIDNHNRWVSVQALRKFVDGFTAKNGFNLNDVKAGRISAKKKRQITAYRSRLRYEVGAINSGHAVVRTYKKRNPRTGRYVTNKEVLAKAVHASQQESGLVKGQRAAVFYTRNPDKFSVKLDRKLQRFVIKDGIYKNVNRVRFDSPEFLKILNTKINKKDYGGKRVKNWKVVAVNDPRAIFEAAKELIGDHKRFALMVGKYSMAPELAGKFVDALRDYIASYEQDDETDWMNSIDFMKGIQGAD